MFKIFNYNGFKYEGDSPLLKNVPDGYGTAYYDDGGKYEGFWVEGKRSGEGKFTTKGGVIYSAHFVNNLPNGEGSVLYTDGGKLTGKFNNGWYMNSGTRIYPNGNKYVGPLQKNAPHGEGTLYYKIGSIYKGEFVEGNRQGKGVLEFREKKYAVYSEAWTNKGPTGISTYFYLDDKGEISAQITGITNETTWLISGFGIGKYDNGKYEGDFKDNMRHGLGKYTFNNGKIQDGQWENGKFLG